MVEEYIKRHKSSANDQNQFKFDEGLSVPKKPMHFKCIVVYFALDGAKVVLLLLGGDKSSQEKDIVLAKGYWREQQRRNTNHG